MLYIAEKPELARAIVEGLGGGTRRNGYYECGSDRVTWCFGHMLELYEPEDYDPAYKKWTLDSLPMFFIPWKKRPVPKSKEQFAIIIGLLREADAVCHAGDPDAEGQLLVDELLQFAAYSGPVKRVLINDNNTEVVKKALANLRDNSEFSGLSAAAEARQVGDQLFGFNLTRLYTLAARREGYTGVLSVGRVQTPILGLVVRRDRENEGHQKIPYFMVHGLFRSGDSRFTAAYQVKPGDSQDDKGRLNHPADAQAIADSIGGKTAVVVSSETKPGETPPPLPYNLLKLQSDASRLHGIGPDKVKTITQNLREKHRLITYNRSDSQYLSDEQHADGGHILAAVADMLPDFAAHRPKLDATRKSRAFDSSKVTAHHAIVPTKAIVAADSLSKEERLVYGLIGRAYMAQFMPSHKWERTVTIFEIEGHTFVHTAKVTLENGWRDLYTNDPAPDTREQDSEDEETSVGHTFTAGQEIPCVSGHSERKETAPKPLYTMSSLLEDLTRVAQYITDEKLRKTLVEKDKDKPGERDINSFVDGLLVYIGTEIARVMDNGLSLNIEKHPCPTCGHAMVLKKAGDKPVWGCSNYPACKTTLPDDNGKPGARSQVLAVADPSVLCLICGKPMRLLDHAKGRFFGCSAYPNCKGSIKAKDGKPVVGQPSPTVSEKHMCKTCEKGLVRRPKKSDGSFFWGCSSYPNCKTTYSDLDGKPNYTAKDKHDYLVSSS